MTEEQKPEEVVEETEVKAEPTAEPTAEEQLALVQKELDDAQKTIKGLQDKDHNFKKLRDLTEKEKAEMSATDLEIRQRQEKLEEEQRTWKENVILEHKNDSLAVLAGDDADLREKIQLHYERIADVAVTKEDINKKMKDAYLLATGDKATTVDPIARANAHYSGRGVVQSNSKLTGGQKDLAAKLGISDEDIKKFNK